MNWKRSLIASLCALLMVALGIAMVLNTCDKEEDAGKGSVNTTLITNKPSGTGDATIPQESGETGPRSVVPGPSDVVPGPSSEPEISYDTLGPDESGPSVGLEITDREEFPTGGTESSPQGGTESGNQSGNQGGNQSGNQGGNQGGNQSGNQGGNQGGTQSGNQGGNQSGNQSGNQGGSQGGNQGGSQGGTASPEVDENGYWTYEYYISRTGKEQMEYMYNTFKQPNGDVDVLAFNKWYNAAREAYEAAHPKETITGGEITLN